MCFSHKQCTCWSLSRHWPWKVSSWHPLWGRTSSKHACQTRVGPGPGTWLHGLWEMGGSGVQHLGAGASPGGVLTASHFGDLTQQLVKKHSWLVYEGGLKFSRVQQKQVHTHTHFYWAGHLLPMCVQLSCSDNVTPPLILLEGSRQLFGRSQESSTSPRAFSSPFPAVV